MRVADSGERRRRAAIWLRALLPVLVCAGLWAGVPAASAHVQVDPTLSAAGAEQHYLFSVPSERPSATVRVRIEIPVGVTVFAFGAAPGWQRELDEDAQGAVRAVTWSGGAILPQEYQAFSLDARNPAAGGRIVWKAVQTYADGSVAAWTGPAGSAQPAAVTTLGGVASRSDASAGLSSGGDAIVQDIALAAALLALALSLLANGLLVLALRRRIV